MGDGKVVCRWLPSAARSGSDGGCRTTQRAAPPSMRSAGLLADWMMPAVLMLMTALSLSWMSATICPSLCGWGGCDVHAR